MGVGTKFYKRMPLWYAKKGHVLCLRDHLCYKLVTEGTIL